MSHRFFVDVPVTGDSAVLTGTEAQHLGKVLRAKVGDEIIVFDGSGSEFLCRIGRIDRACIDLDVLSRQETDRELPLDMTIAVALPKGDRQRWLVEKLTELGVSRLVPMQVARGVAQPEPQAIARLRRWVVEASKQCGRNRLMEIAAATPFAAVIEGHFSTQPSMAILVHPASGPADGSPRRLVELSMPERGPGGVVAVLGPEGGFEEHELALAARYRWQFVDLGTRILRVETAAISVAAWFANVCLPGKRNDP